MHDLVLAANLQHFDHLRQCLTGRGVDTSRWRFVTDPARQLRGITLARIHVYAPRLGQTWMDGRPPEYVEEVRTNLGLLMATGRVTMRWYDEGGRVIDEEPTPDPAEV